MKNLLRKEASLETLIARFGEATLVQTCDGRMELRGGSPNDCIEAREWISMFLPDVVARMKQTGESFRVHSS